MAAVFEHSEARGNDRLVLLALADQARDDSWSSWPSVRTIATKARVSERTVQRCIRALAADGHIVIIERSSSEGRYATNRYLILRPWESEGCQDDSRQVVTPVKLTGVRTRTGGVTDQASGVTPVTPEPLLDQPLEEPSSSPPAKPATKQPRGTRCPEPFFVTHEMRGWATTEVPDVDVTDQTRRFVDYWRGISGARGVKVDWLGTWRNWMRKAQDDKRPRSGPKSKSERQADAIRVASARLNKAANQ